MYLNILWKMEHLLFGANAPFFYNIFKSTQNLAEIFLELFQVCLKIENDVMI